MRRKSQMLGRTDETMSLSLFIIICVASATEKTYKKFVSEDVWEYYL